MRYVRKKIVEATYVDDDIRDSQSILSLIEALRATNVPCSIEYLDAITYGTRRIPKCKIESVGKNGKLTIFVIGSNGYYRNSNFDYKSITKIEVITKEDIKYESNETSYEDTIDI
jgi:hypothetical protein